MNRAFLLFSALTCISLSAIRWFMTDSNGLLFLNWNLLLAFVPYFLSQIMLRLQYAGQSSHWVLLPLWLLFFPNSPYILTDLFHLRTTGAAPLWFDLFLLLGFAWTGLFAGFMSLNDVRHFCSIRMRWPLTDIAISLLLFLAAFGVYLGRFLRWNSWDALHQPTALLLDLSDRIIHPGDHPRTWGFTLGFGLLLNLIYWSIHYKRTPSLTSAIQL